MTDRPLIQKELARELGRSRKFIRALQDRGLRLPATVAEAIRFWKRHPHPCSRKKGQP